MFFFAGPDLFFLVCLCNFCLSAMAHFTGFPWPPQSPPSPCFQTLPINPRSCWFVSWLQAGTCWCSHSSSAAPLLRCGAVLPCLPAGSMCQPRSTAPGLSHRGRKILAAPWPSLCFFCTGSRRWVACCLSHRWEGGNCLLVRAGTFCAYWDWNKVPAEYFHLVCPFRNLFVRSEIMSSHIWSVASLRVWISSQAWYPWKGYLGLACSCPQKSISQNTRCWCCHLPDFCWSLSVGLQSVLMMYCKPDQSSGV